jgi:hypothetical protein
MRVELSAVDKSAVGFDNPSDVKDCASSSQADWIAASRDLAARD